MKVMVQKNHKGTEKLEKIFSELDELITKTEKMSEQKGSPDLQENPEDFTKQTMDRLLKYDPEIQNEILNNLHKSLMGLRSMEVENCDKNLEYAQQILKSTPFQVS